MSFFLLHILFGRSPFYAFPVRHRSFLSNDGMDLDVKKMGMKKSCYVPSMVSSSIVKSTARLMRSFEKLTAGGMTFLDSDVIQALEEVLPEQCGGGPGDYQLAESESEDGWPRLALIVHPRVGPVDESKAIDAFYAAIGRGVGAERVMALHLRQSRLLHVRREAPRMTPGGKILHLHAGSHASRATAR